MSAGNQLPNLDKIFKEDDEPDFLPSSGSNLAAIFGLQSKSSESHGSPKQTHKKSAHVHAASQPQAISQVEVIIAKPVYAFKLKNGTYVPVGKIGMALTGNIAQKAYQIILYRSKQEHISVTLILSNFVYRVQENNYSSYYDNNSENWSILFENTDACTQFAREIALAKYFCTKGRIEKILQQELTPATKETGAKEGNSVHIKYSVTTEIVQPLKANSPLSQTMTAEISTDDNWERELLGVTKGLKKILFLPPSKQISLGPGFPKDRDVMLEIEVIDIKVMEEKPDDLKPDSTSKVAILSRMAKVGQSMLPKIPTVPSTDSEDTEDDVPQKSPNQKKVESLGKILQKKNLLEEHTEDVPRTLQKSHQFTFENSMMYATGPPATSLQVNALQPQAVPLALPSMVDQSLNLMMSETRMANTELRMGMYKISDNIQKLLDKFHAFELQNATSPSADKATMEATLKMLLSGSVPLLEKRQNDLSKGSVDTCNMNSDNSSELKDLKHEILALKSELKDTVDSLLNSRDSIKHTESENEAILTLNKKLEEKVQNLQQSVDTAYEVLCKTSEDMGELKNLNNEYCKRITEADEKICKLEMEQAILKKNINTADGDKEAKSKEIKSIMNNMYRILMDKFQEDSYSTDYIKATIASTIKSITLHVLGEHQEKPEKELEYSNATENAIQEEENGLNHPKEMSNCSQQTNFSESRTISNMLAVQDIPPPIPPNDTDTDND